MYSIIYTSTARVQHTRVVELSINPSLIQTHDN